MDRLITITDGAVEVGVIPDLGGMVALLRLAGKPNILKADASLWKGQEAPAAPRSFGPNPEFEANNGHIVWLGPQSHWWTQQDVYPEMRAKKSSWPPDPYINHGHFEVVEKKDSSIVMKGPKSEFSGIQLTKAIRIRQGRVYFKVFAQNIRSEPVAWDLWLNTRVSGYARCYVPIGFMNRVRIDGKTTDTTDMGAFAHDSGYCSTAPRAPSKGKVKRWAKAYIPVPHGVMAAFDASQALIIRFHKYSKKLTHPEQSIVELYNYTTHDKKEALTELEYHAPYIKLSPGGWMEATQTWELHPFKTKPTHEDCVAFLREMNI